jgi:hypothetical protein
MRPCEVLGNHRRQSPQCLAGAWARFQPLILTGEQSGLRTRIAATRAVLIVRPGPPGAPGRPNCDGNNDDGGDGNTLYARDANRMTVLRSTHSRVAGSNTPRWDNTRIRNGDSRS